jgi:hypothetical protein
MHENREISITPSLVEEGRSAKAINHNGDVYVVEKSHGAVVPVNQPNKGANALAEVGEGRAPMEENTAQPSMHLTQSGKRMSHRGWTVCEKQQGKEGRNGSLPCSTI